MNNHDDWQFGFSEFVNASISGSSTITLHFKAGKLESIDHDYREGQIFNWFESIVISIPKIQEEIFKFDFNNMVQRSLLQRSSFGALRSASVGDDDHPLESVNGSLLKGLKVFR